ncbi:hypothetical protein ACHAXT_006429 [Thalassiosira profunda]
MTSVCSSIRSNGSSKYRRIASGSSVDQSLFGSRKGASISSTGEVRPAKPKKTPGRKQVPPAATRASISSSELDRIRRSAATPIAQMPAAYDDAHDGSKPPPAQSEAAKARKEHMKRLELEDLERQRKMGTQCDEAKLARIRKEAQEKMDEGQDIVKLLKTCSERATTFAIRDQQLKDKAEREKKEQDYEQRMILAMEIDRLREIEAREAEEERKVRKMVDDRKIIEDQIEERHQAKLLTEEARDQENRDMLDRIQLYQEQDEEKARQRREDAARARVEIIRANEEHIASKRERKILEKREDEMMVAYQLQQDEKMRQREAEEEEADRKKRLMLKKMLDEQERTMDRRSEMDELRARRAMEDAERKYRQKQLAEAQKKKRDMDTLDMARKQQQREKHEREQLELEQKREEYENALRHSHALAERERAEAEYVQRKNSELIVNLQTQIEENRVRRSASRKETYKEGAMLKQQLAEERAKLEAVRDKMVASMRAKGIDERYFGEMISLDIGNLMTRI